MRSPTTVQDTDVLIIGGGPAGTTAGALLAERGHAVILLEKDTHPRFHIGESLLPGNLRILERLGVLEAVAGIGEFKPGADFTAPDGNTQSFPFARALGDTPAHAYQVRRSEFDALLFRNCMHKGVDARERHRVVALTREGAMHRASVVAADEGQYEIRARFVVDASGRDGFMAKRNGWQRRNPRHASAAVFGHFRNVARRSGDRQGNISVYWFEHGWCWMIPLKGDVMSVGAVCLPSYLKTRQGDLESFLRSTLASVPEAAARMANAEAASPVSATGNYSYRSRRLHGPGYLLAGDAFAFIDPVFSSGVYLAMNGALTCIPAVEAWLAGDQRAYARACRHYQQIVNSKIDAFSWFIYRFTTPTMRDLFRNPRNDWQVEQAVISMLAGDGDGTRDIVSRLRLFKTIYYSYRMRLIGASVHAWWRRRRAWRVPFVDETLLP
ncbi:MAG: tryptophan 7-halogenase [Pseudomonadales bacterium]